VASQSTTTFQDLNLTPKTSYSYTVEAYDSDGHVSAPTAALNITTLADTTPPTVPTNLTDSLSTTSPSTSVVLNWTASSDAVGISGYQIFRNGNLITTTSGTGTTYTDNNLTPSTTYTYQLTAVDTLGNISAKASATPATITTASPPVNSLTPNTPTNFRAMFVSSFVTYLRWNEANTTGKVSGFRIYSGSKVIDTTNSTQGFAAIFNLKEGQTYTLYVQAYYGSLNSNLSTGLTITIPNNLYGGPATSNTTTANSNLTVTPQNAPSAISLPSTVTAQLTTAATVTPAIVSNSPQGGNVAAVKYYVNNNLVATTTTAPYSYNLNTPNMLNGDYTLTAKVIYKSGSVVTSNHEIEVSNPTSFAQFRLAIQRYWLAEIIVLAVLVAAWSSYRQRIKLLNLKQDGLLASDDESKINLPNSDSTFESNEEPPKVGQIIHSEHHHNDDADDN
jgi:chitodextrinase